MAASSRTQVHHPSVAVIRTAYGRAGVEASPLATALDPSFSEPIEPSSVLAGWSGAATDVVFKLVNGAPAGAQDRVSVWNAANTLQLPLGSVTLGRADYTDPVGLTFGLTGTPSRMARSGSTITLGTPSSAGGPTRAAGTGTMTWAGPTVPIDRAGNSISNSTPTESGAADAEF